MLIRQVCDLVLQQCSQSERATADASTRACAHSGARSGTAGGFTLTM